MSTGVQALSDRELVLGRYRPLRPIGRGGSGSVWLARDERSGLEVALKIVPREGKRAARAMREMEAASRLRHERCVRAYDFGGDDGHVYIAYEYVPGQTMRELLRSGKLNDREAVESAAQVLDGLAHAHQRGIVHRDVKPSNVLVEEGPETSVRLVDFGLAQFDEADTLTAVGDVPGTLAYISPERLTGGEASDRSDVWSVGVLLWESLAGQHPFWGVPLPQVAATITSGAPPLASQRPDLPRRLVQAVDGALSVDPSRRPSARRLAHELRDAYLDPHRPRDKRAGRPARARPTHRSKTAGPPFPARVPQAVAAGAVTAGAAAMLPFWPAQLVAALALGAAAAAVRSPRAGLAIALFAPLFPLGNYSAGAALAYALVAGAWLAAWWREPRAGLGFAAGPLLGAIGLIGLVPLVAQTSHRPWRRALMALAGTLTAILVSGIQRGELLLSGDRISEPGIRALASPYEVVTSLLRILQAEPGLIVLACVLAAVSVWLPYARRRGRIEVAILAALQIAALLAFAGDLPWPGLALGSAALGLAAVLPDPRRLLQMPRGLTTPAAS